MIKIFRTIRKKLFDESKVRNYAIYTIGEIILVVIGILIALQINNWNEGIKLNKSVKQSLSSLVTDLKKDSTQLSNDLISINQDISQLLGFNERLSKKFSKY